MIIKDTPGSSSFVQVTEGSSQLASGPVSVTATNDSGVFINGPLSISSSIDRIKVGGGIFRFNSMLSTGIASTMVTPMPVLKVDLPISNISTMVAIAAIAKSIGI